VEESGPSLLRPRMARAVTKQGFTMIPDEIAHRTDLLPLAKLVFGFMVRKARNGSLSLGGQFFAEFWGSSKSRIAYAITQLEEVGLIAVERTGIGKRYIYNVLQYQNKASNTGTLSDNETVECWDTVSNVGTEVSNAGTRMRQRPSESKKNPPTPQGGRERIRSENGTEEKTKSRKGPTASPELREAVVALFYGSGVPKTQLRYFNPLVNDLALLSATPVEVRRRHKHWPEKFPGTTCTLRSLVKHWGVLCREPYEWEKEEDGGE